MTLETIKAIEKLLNDDLKSKEKSLEIAREKVNRLEDEYENHPEKSNGENLKYWMDSRKKKLDALSDARRVLEDFYAHDWR
ncbi:MAG: hypothetical protein IKW37_01205 [Bacteroidaceae bacterium]|nr:hypothetical protein [Bacteroidaceae bacterium]